MARKVAVKRLSAVEVDPKQSHQHEFHAGLLKAALNMGDDKISGPLRLEVHGSGGVVTQDDSFYTLYDARALHPKRSEWRLYFSSKVLGESAHPGDLLVIFRPDDESTDLLCLVVAAGSESETRLLSLLQLGNGFDLERFLALEPAPPDVDAATRLALTLWSDDATVAGRQVDDAGAEELVRQAVAADRAPTALEMAGAASRLAVIPTSDPDGYLVSVLDLETELYFRIETQIQERRLRSLLNEGGAVPEVLDWAMSVHQARRSRRGQSLQLHFARLLDAHGLRYTAQCATEVGEKPDFVHPGCAEYHDPNFPGERLRIVACKSTSKERWRQILNEAHRVPIKYLLTLDPALSEPTIAQMVAAGLLPHLPATILESFYAMSDQRSNLGTVAGLLEKLEAATL